MPPGMNTAMNAWLRDHPWQADGLLAAVLLVVSAAQLAAGRTGAAGGSP